MTEAAMFAVMCGREGIEVMMRPQPRLAEYDDQQQMDDQWPSHAGIQTSKSNVIT